MSLKQSHDLSHQIEEQIRKELADVADVSVNFEFVKQKHILAEDVTEQSQDMIREISGMINMVPEKLNCHDIRVYAQGERVALFLHCEMSGSYTTGKTEKIIKNISNKIKSHFKNIDSVHIHVEPID